MSKSFSNKRLHDWIPRPGRATFVFLFLAFAGAAFAPGLFAQTSAAKPGPSNRYLFIVDTSFSMYDRAMGVQTVVRNLLQSGMNGQLRRGDTLGVWTFNEKLYAGRLPLQRWTPEAQQIITLRTLEFLGKQHYEKTTALDDALAEMARVIENSDAITVILISDADEKIKGTPFDAAINAIYSQNYRRQKKAQMPFTTILRAESGTITGYKVNMAPWPLELPPLPPETQRAEATANKPVEVQPKAPAPVVQPLILSGKKTMPSTTASAGNSAKAEAAPPQPAPATRVPEKAAETPKPKTEPVMVPKPASVPAPTLATESPAPAIAPDNNLKAGVPATPPPVPAQPAAAPKTEPTPAAPEMPTAQSAISPAASASKTVATEAAPPQPVPPTMVPENPIETPKPKTEPVMVAETASVPAPAMKPPAPTIVPDEKPKVETPANPASVPAQPAAAPKIEPAPAPAKPPKPPPVVEIAQAKTPPVANASSPKAGAPPVPAKPPGGWPGAALKNKTSAQPATAPVQTAVTVPPKALFSRKGIWIAGLVLLGIAVGFVVLSKRRSRTTPHASLITYSLDHDKK